MSVTKYVIFYQVSRMKFKEKKNFVRGVKMGGPQSHHPPQGGGRRPILKRKIAMDS